jgi:hypothetical protein
VLLKYPLDGILWRGGQLPDKHRDFFRVEKKYRAPAFMSTSIDEKVAERFLYEASQHGACVKWKIMLHPEGATIWVLMGWDMQDILGYVKKISFSLV